MDNSAVFCKFVVQFSSTTTVNHIDVLTNLENKRKYLILSLLDNATFIKRVERRKKRHCNKVGCSSEYN